MQTKERHMKAIATKVKACRACHGMNVENITESAPGYGNPDSPVAIIGQSLCRECMKSQIPFTGGCGRYIDAALQIADKPKRQLFITNIVHCHPEDDRKSKRHEIANCRHFLLDELKIVAPSLVIGLGEDAKAELPSIYPNARELPWPFVKPRARKADTTYLLFPEHPGSLRFKKTPDRAYWSPSLAAAIRWGFREK